MGFTEGRLRRIRRRYRQYIPESEETLAWDVVKREDPPLTGVTCALIATERAVYAIYMLKGRTAAVAVIPYEQMAIAAEPMPNVLAIEYVLDDGEHRLLQASGGNIGTGFRPEFLALLRERAPRWTSFEDCEESRRREQEPGEG